MKLDFTKIAFICFLILISNCNYNKLITYQYREDLSEEITRIINKLRKSNFSIRNGEKLTEIFVLVDYDESGTTLIFNFFENMPKSIQNQIDNSNRYLVIENIKFPVLFYFDDGTSELRVNGIGHGIIGGYLINFDNEGNILMKGPVM